jgi:hypothetical protein
MSDILGVNRLRAYQLDEQQQAVRLANAMTPSVIETALAEVERRTVTFDAHRRASVRAPAVTPRSCALRSVIDDIISGRLQ